MEIGVGLPTNLRSTNKQLLLEWAQRAEAAGFASLCMGERLTYAGYDWVLSLTAAAAVTSRIRLLSNVVILPIHPVGVVAKQSLSLDDFSGGRFSLGVGLGTPLDDYDVAPSAREGRGQRFEASMRTLRELWKGESLIEGTRAIGPPPAKPGGPELLLGANGPKALRRVGEFADGVQNRPACRAESRRQAKTGHARPNTRTAKTAVHRRTQGRGARPRPAQYAAAGQGSAPDRGDP